MKYQVWDKVSDVITPSGNVFTAEEWIREHPAAGVVDTICSAGEVNGEIFGVYSQFVSMKEAEGCDFTGCVTKQDYLDRIEEFENEKNSQAYIADETRIADALEDLVVLNMPDEEVE